MKIRLFQVDAFSSRVFGGNPAAVCPLERWLDDTTLQSIALENNLSETAFLTPAGAEYDLRWFTPTVEVPLCGHATLASGFVTFNLLQPQRQRVTFHTKSGPLQVERDGDWLAMDLPALPSKACTPPALLLEALGATATEVVEADWAYLVVLDSADTVRNLAPDFSRLNALGKNVVISAAGGDADFVSRFFAPASGVPEDPVTGSAHCILTPYWSKRLGKSKLVARQVSHRGGELRCELRGERVRMAGQAVLYLEGTIEI